MSVLDPSGFQMAVRIITPEGVRHDLWPSAGAPSFVGNPGSLPQNMPIVESVDIDITIGRTATVTINIAAPFELGLRILESDLLRMGNAVEVQVGYPRAGKFMPWVTGAARMPTISVSAADGLTATINVNGAGFAAFRGDRTVEYRGRSYAEIIQELIGGTDYNFIVTLPERQAGDDPLYTLRDRVSQTGTDWFFLQYITRAANCDAWTQPSRDEEGREEYIVSRRSAAWGAAPRYAFLARGGKANFDNLFPFFEFTANAEGVWLPGAATSVLMGGINPADLAVSSVLTTDTRVPATDETVPSDGGARIEDTETRLTPARNAETAGEHVFRSERDPRTAAEVADAVLTEARGRASVQATMTTFGIPDLFPGEIVAVQGLGVLSSFYQVTKAVHRLSSSEWTMTMDLINNAVATDLMAAALGAPAAVTTTATVPEPTPDAEGGGRVVEPEELLDETLGGIGI